MIMEMDRKNRSGFYLEFRIKETKEVNFLLKVWDRNW